MIAAARGNITNLPVNFAGSRPAMTLLAVATLWTTSVSINRRRATPLLPIAIGRSNSIPPSTASQIAGQRTSATDRRRRNPHSV
jgi:hypothetical protein